MGGTPAVKMLREAMVGDEVEPVAGILNGTCNYILTEMEATGRAFADVLAEAQRLGYAEADPDHGRRRLRRRRTRSPSWPPWRSAARPTYAAAEIEGIDADRADRHPPGQGPRLPHQAGGAARRSRRTASRSACIRRWRRSAIRWRRPAAPLNALFIEGEQIGRIFIQGPGAGAGPTAAAVAADIADVMTGARAAGVPGAGDQAEALRPRWTPAASWSRAYIRLLVRDEPGVIAAISETLAEAGVSIDSFLQKPVEDAGGVPIVLTTHAAPEQAIAEAVRRMRRLPALIEPPRMIRIARI